MDKLTLIKALLCDAGSDAEVPAAAVVYPWKIGGNYLIRTVTYTQSGRLVAATATELVLEDAAWIADTGRFSDALKACNFGEVEPFPTGQVIVGRGAVIDAVRIDTPPRTQK